MYKLRAPVSLGGPLTFRRFALACALGALISSAVCVWIPMLTIAVSNRYNPLDAAFAYLCDFPGSTRWSADFTEAKFSAIRPGMTPDEVRALCGEPVRSRGDWWWYTDHNGRHSHYHLRSIHFENGRVEYTIREFYVD